MKPERFEEWLPGTPVRRLPPEWKTDILGVATAAAVAPRPRAGWAAALWPSPVAWAALAAIWLLVLGLNLAVVRSGPARPGAATGGGSALAERRRLVEELAGGPPTPAPASLPARQGHSFVAPDRHGRGILS